MEVCNKKSSCAEKSTSKNECGVPQESDAGGASSGICGLRQCQVVALREQVVVFNGDLRVQCHRRCATDLPQSLAVVGQREDNGKLPEHGVPAGALDSVKGTGTCPRSRAQTWTYAHLLTG